MSDMLRITGMVSGMDTDATVKKLIQLEQSKVDTAKQDKQIIEWQRESYREISASLKSFQDEYFNLLKPSQNLRSGNAFNMFKASASIAGVASTSVSMTTTSKSLAGKFTINSITQLATKDTYESGSQVKGNITSTGEDLAAINTAIDSDQSMKFTFDGVTKTVELTKKTYASEAEFATELTTKLQEAFSGVDITVDTSGGNFEFKIYKDGTTTEESGHMLTIGDENSDLLTAAGLKVGQSDGVNTSATLEDVFGKTSSVSFKINDVSFSFEKDAKISDVINQINSSTAGVTMSYDGISDKFKLESNTAGTDKTITMDDTSGLLADMKLTGGSETYTAAKNSIFTVNGVETTRAGNTFEYNGTTIELKELSASAIDINVETDTKDVKDLIVKFVDEYNKVIEKINSKANEKRDYDYKPLTETQKKDMKEDDIKKWEEKAKAGILKNDDALQKITRDMRRALYESVDGIGISLHDIGITSSANFREEGKLVIDETKLDKALKEKPNEVISLFTNESSTEYTDYDNRSTRYKENGLAHRLYDILQDNIRLTRDDAGNKGYLIDKAGLDTGVDVSSDLAKQIKVVDERISDLLVMLAAKENKYYAQFAAMESAMSRLQAQSASVLSSLGAK